MKTIVTYGEVMCRFSTVGFKRFRQSIPGSLEMTYAGAEANVAVSIALLGGNSRFVTALPQNDISDACVSHIRGLGVDISSILKSNHGRFGFFFVETGANQRGGKVVYDRDHSSFSLTPFEDYNWDEIFDNACWFHCTGISPALTEISADSTIKAYMKAKEYSMTTSCDINFRNNLWKWDSTLSSKTLAQKIMRMILPHVDILIANDAQLTDVLGITYNEVELKRDRERIQSDLAKEVISQFPNIKKVALTLRENISASYNRWGAMLYDSEEDLSYFSPVTEEGNFMPYDINNIVDRIGAGDAFTAGLIFALDTPELKKNNDALRFATASSCLNHSIEYDFHFVTRDEVETLMNGNSSGRISR